MSEWPFNPMKSTSNLCLDLLKCLWLSVSWTKLVFSLVWFCLRISNFQISHPRFESIFTKLHVVSRDFFTRTSLHAIRPNMLARVYDTKWVDICIQVSTRLEDFCFGFVFWYYTILMITEFVFLRDEGGRRKGFRSRLNFRYWNLSIPAAKLRQKAINFDAVKFCDKIKKKLKFWKFLLNSNFHYNLKFMTIFTQN